MWVNSTNFNITSQALHNSFNLTLQSIAEYIFVYNPWLISCQFFLWSAWRRWMSFLLSTPTSSSKSSRKKNKNSLIIHAPYSLTITALFKCRPIVANFLAFYCWLVCRFLIGWAISDSDSDWRISACLTAHPNWFWFFFPSEHFSFTPRRALDNSIGSYFFYIYTSCGMWKCIMWSKRKRKRFVDIKIN